MDARRPPSPFGGLVVAWGLGGVLALLGSAVFRLAPKAAEALVMDLGPGHWALLGLWVVFMGYAEGWRGFHQRFSPRVVARAFHLGRAPTLVTGLLAPLYCMSLFGSTRRGKIVAWSLLGGITALVVLVRMTPQPWRGIVDTGVVLGLGMGSASILWHAIRALRHGAEAPTDLPVSEARVPAE